MLFPIATAAPAPAATALSVASVPPGASLALATVSNPAPGGRAVAVQRGRAGNGELQQLNVAGVPRRDLDNLARMLGRRGIGTDDLRALIRERFGATEVGRAMIPALVDAAMAPLRGLGELHSTNWKHTLEDALSNEFDAWHKQHAHPTRDELPSLPANDLLRTLHKLLSSNSGVPSWEKALPAREVPPVATALITMANEASLASEVQGPRLRVNGPGAWLSTGLAVLAAAGGLPGAHAQDGHGDLESGADSIQPLVEQFHPALKSTLPWVGTTLMSAIRTLDRNVVNLVMEHPRTVAAAATASMIWNVVSSFAPGPVCESETTAPLTTLDGDVPLARLDGIVPEGTQRKLIDIVRQGNADDAFDDPTEAVAALGEHADVARLAWRRQFSRGDVLPFVEPDATDDLAFGQWLVRQVLAEPVPPGGQDLTWNRFSLPNGLRVIHVQGKGDKMSVQLHFPYGSAIERTGQKGVVHALEHFWFLKNMPGETRFDSAFARAGAADNAYTHHDATVYHTTGPNDALELALAEKSYRMEQSRTPLTQGEFEAERGVVINELRARNTANARAHKVLAREMYPRGHPYRDPVAGSPADIMGLPLNEMNMLRALRQGPANATLVVSSNVPEEDVESLVRHYFSDIEPGNRFKALAPDVHPRTLNTNSEIFDSVPHSMLFRAWNVPADGNADLPALEMAAYTLTRRLNAALEDDCFFAVAYVDRRSLGSQFRVELQVRDSADLQDVEEILDREFSAFLREGPTQGEVDRARKTMAAALARKGGSSDELASMVVQCLDRNGTPDCINDDARGIEASTSERVAEVARAWLARGSHTLLQSPGGKPGLPVERPGPGPGPAAWDLGVRDPALHAVSTQVDRTKLPELPPPGPVKFPPVVRGRLANGVPMLHVSMPGDRGRLILVFEGGIRGDRDPDVGKGAAKMVSNMLAQRANSPGGDAPGADMVRLGVTVAVTAKPDHTEVVLHGPAANLPEATRLVKQMLESKDFDSHVLEMVRADLESDRRALRTRLTTLTFTVMVRRVLGADHPDAADPIGAGTAASLAQMTPAQLERWSFRYLNPANATVIAIGPDDPGWSSAIDSSFGTIADAGSRRRIDVPLITAPVHPGVELMPLPSGRVSRVLMSWPEPRDGGTGGIVPTLLANIIEARFTQKFREQDGISYGATSRAHSCRGTRVFVVGADVESKRGSYALATAYKIVADMASGAEPVTESELAEHAGSWRRTLVSHYTDPQNVADAMVHEVNLGRAPDHVTRSAEIYASLTLAEVNRGARRMSAGHVTWMLAGSAANAGREASVEDSDAAVDARRDLEKAFQAMNLTRFHVHDVGTGAIREVRLPSDLDRAVVLRPSSTDATTHDPG